jgi:hypothetical protein
MTQKECRHDDVIDVLKNSDIAYAFKKKRLRYIRSASVKNEVRHLRDVFHGLWAEEEGLFRLKDPSLTRDSISIILGIFGKSDEATALFDVNSAFSCIDLNEFSYFIEAHIASRKARENLIAIFSAGPDSILDHVRRQNAFLVRVISTMKKFDIEDIADLRINSHDKDMVIEFVANLGEIEKNLSRDIELYERFMRDFRRLYRGNAEVDVIGYGEISTVMRLRKAGWSIDNEDIVRDESLWIWKKMPPFPDLAEVERFEKLYFDYRNLLIEKIGITVPRQTIRFFRHDTYYTVYAGQEKVDGSSICNLLIKKLDERNAGRILEMILRALGGVFSFNRTDRHVSVGIDAQLSNWSLVTRHGLDGTIHDDDGLVYIDTSSPLIKIDGEEQINTEIFIKSAASFLRPVIRAFFLKEVVDRYYDFRSVMIDIIANLHKEKRADLIDSFLGITNDYCTRNNLDIQPITRKEIDSYYSSDAFIWKFYQASRKLERFITEKLLRRKYNFRIPGAIDRERWSAGNEVIYVRYVCFNAPHFGGRMHDLGKELGPGA